MHARRVQAGGHMKGPPGRLRRAGKAPTSCRSGRGTASPTRRRPRRAAAAGPGRRRAPSRGGRHRRRAPRRSRDVSRRASSAANTARRPARAQRTHLAIAAPAVGRGQQASTLDRAQQVVPLRHLERVRVAERRGASAADVASLSLGAAPGMSMRGWPTLEPTGARPRAQNSESIFVRGERGGGDRGLSGVRTLKARALRARARVPAPSRRGSPELVVRDAGGAPPLPVGRRLEERTAPVLKLQLEAVQISSAACRALLVPGKVGFMTRSFS